MKWFAGVMTVAVLGSTYVGASGAITGRVVDGSSNGLAHAKVWLKSNPSVSDSTDDQGTFTLEVPTTGMRGVQAAGEITPLFRVRNNRMIFTSDRLQLVTLELFDIRGSRIAVLYRGPVGPGNNSIPLDDNLKRCPSGSYVLRCSGPAITVTPVVEVADGTSLVKSQQTVPLQSGTVRATAVEPDTLIVLRMGYEISKVALANVEPQELQPVALSLRGYRLAATTTVKQGRTIEVVLPSDYDELYALPVLYLLHGGGEDHTAWRVKGQLIEALNGLDFPERDEMQAMIIVTPDAQSSAYGDYGRDADPFYADLTKDIREHVESNYNVDTSRYARAISGFSMGAMQTHNLTIFYPELFGYSCSISGGLNLSNGYSESTMRSDIADGTIDTALVNSMKLYRLHSNPTDAAYTNGDTPSFDAFLESVGIVHSSDFTSYSIGGHTFSYCNGVFKAYSGLLFKN